MTSTQTLKQRLRALATLPHRDAAQQKALGDWRTQLLCRGIVAQRSKRGAIAFTHVGHVPDDSPLWQQVHHW